jgi:hypothetical protein
MDSFNDLLKKLTKLEEGYADLSPAERTALRIKQNREIDAKADVVNDQRKQADRDKMQKQHSTVAQKYMKSVEPKKSCWGCGSEWKDKWSPEEVATVSYEKQKTNLCPDCQEEVTNNGEIKKFKFLKSLSR